MAMSTITLPARIFSTIAVVTMTGAFFPKTCAVVMTTSASAHSAAMASRCFASCSGVSACA